MLKYLNNNLDWNHVEIVGFDLDGTLYDEFDFISQVYRPIAEILAEHTFKDAEIIYNTILQRWIEKGSSYNKIFDEVLIESSVLASKRPYIISKCLSEFRNYQPRLCLPRRVEQILNWLSPQFRLFLVTDGGQSLQQAKISSLGLSRWFSPDNISISGSFDQKIAKPDKRMISHLATLKDHFPKPRSVIYFGDRSVDADFAKNCGFDFIKVKVMIPFTPDLIKT